MLVDATRRIEWKRRLESGIDFDVVGSLWGEDLVDSFNFKLYYCFSS